MQEDNLQSLLDLQQNELGAISSVSDGIDARNFAILGANIAILIFIAQSNVVFGSWQFFMAAAPFLLSVVCNIKLIWPSQYRGNADVMEQTQYFAMDRTQLLLQLISDTQAALDANSRCNKTRMKWCLVSLSLDVIGVVVLFGILKIWSVQ